MRGSITLGPLLCVGLAACAGTPKDDSDGPFIKLAVRGLGVWVIPNPQIDPRAQQELELQLGSELTRLYQTDLKWIRGPGRTSPLDARKLYALADQRADDLVLVEPRRTAAGLGARVSVLTVTDERVILRFEIEPRAREQGDSDRLARRIADRLGAQFTDPGAGIALDPPVVADRLAERGACAEAVRLYDRNLPRGSEAKVSVAHATKEYAHRRSLEVCRAKLELAAKREADRTARFSLTYDLEFIDPSFHAPVKETAGRAGLEAALRKLSDKPATLQLSKSSLLVHLRYHPERYKRAVGQPRSVHREQPAIFFDAWRPALVAATAMVEGLADRIPGTAVESYLRLTTLEGDWLEIGFARVGKSDSIRISDRLRVHQDGVQQDTMVESTSIRDLRDLIFVLGPPRTLDGKGTIYGPPVDFLGL